MRLGEPLEGRKIYFFFRFIVCRCSLFLAKKRAAKTALNFCASSEKNRILKACQSG